MTQENKNVALVLSSGGPRGFAYIGAIEELESRGYTITSVAGSSIGSLVGGIYASGRLPEFKEWIFNLDNMKLMRLLDVSITRSYLLKGERVMDAIKKIVPDVLIEDMAIPYAAVATDLYTAETVVFREGRLFDAVRASISIPSLFRPVKQGFRTMIDGGLVSTLPLAYVDRREGDILVGFDVNDCNAEEITAFLKIVERQKRQKDDMTAEAIDTVKRAISTKGVSLMDRVKMIDDERNRVASFISSKESVKNPVEADDNYLSIITRSFAIANHTIARLEAEIYKPDVLVSMSFDSYGSIPDYVKAEEISDRGRTLMAEALDEYESRSL